MIAWSVHHGDCRAVLQALPDACVDAVVTDPPYGLGADADIHKVLADWLAGRTHCPAGGGYQGRKWDAFVPGPDVWREVLRVLVPGGHILASSSTRTSDLLGLALRLAGAQIRDTLTWCYGTGTVVSMGLPDGGGTGLKRSQEPWLLARKPPGTLPGPGLRVYNGENSPGDTAFHPANFLTDGSDLEGQPKRPIGVFYQAKAAAAEADFGLEHWPWITSFTDRKEGSAGVIHPRAGTGRLRKRKNPHATVKPLALLEHFVGLLTLPDTIVLDPFCGSGTTGMVCVGTGRHFIGCDIDETSVRAARDRIKAVENL